MPMYELGVRTVNTAAFTCAAEIIAHASLPTLIMELWYTQIGSAGAIGFGKPLVAGITPTKVLVQAQNPSDPAGATGVAVAWGTAPTMPTATTAFLRRVSNNNNPGEGVVWTWPFGLRVAANGTYGVFNTASSSNADVFFVVDE